MDIEIYDMVREAQRLLKTNNTLATNDQLQLILNTFDSRAEHQYELSQITEMSDDILDEVFGAVETEVK